MNYIHSAFVIIINLGIVYNYIQDDINIDWQTLHSNNVRFIYNDIYFRSGLGNLTISFSMYFTI